MVAGQQAEVRPPTPTVLRARYAVSGTEIGYGATHPDAVSSTDAAYDATRSRSSRSTGTGRRGKRTG
eukprot:745223-Rhodomonas_salina.1